MNELSALIEKSRNKIPNAIKTAVVDTAVAVVKESPYFSGQLKASTNISFNNPDLSVVTAENYEYGAIQATDSSAENTFNSVIGGYKLGDTVFISNDQDYAAIQEYKRGHLMFSKAAKGFQMTLDRAVNAA